MIYCDASLLVALVVFEKHSDQAERWLERQAKETLAISPWVLTEVASALAMKRRRGLLTEQQWQRATALVKQISGDVCLLPVEMVHFEGARVRMVHAGSRGLRAGDALHLAIATAHDASMATLDIDLFDAAAGVGLGVERVIDGY